MSDAKKSAVLAVEDPFLRDIIQSADELANELQRLPFPQNTACIKAQLIADNLRAHLAFELPELPAIEDLQTQLSEALEKANAYDAINTPEIADFLNAVKNEALHQRERWGVDHDAGKTRPDWIALLVYLLGKATKAHFDRDQDKLLHHVITLAAACLNWHAQETGAHQRMRPGLAPIDAASSEASAHVG